MSTDRAHLENPGDLFFGLNDLAKRLRSLRREEADSCWPQIRDHIDGLLQSLDAFGQPLQTPAPHDVDAYQRLVLAIEALHAARHSADECSLAPTAEAVLQASMIVRGCASPEQTLHE
jgi:hypothetical protein